MKIKAGKYYKTRIGNRVFVCVTNKPGKYPVVGWIDNGQTMTFTDSGRFNGDGDNDEHADDIISEWHGMPEIPWDKLFPPWVKWFAVDEDGEQRGFSNAPEIVSFGWLRNNNSEGAVIVPKRLKIQFSGNWKESLTERK